MTLSYPDLALHIGGEWLAGNDRDVFQVTDPAIEAPLAALPLANAADLDRALHAAQGAFRGWSKTPAPDRAAILHKAASLMRERADAMAYVMTREEGKPLMESKREVLFSADTLDWYAEEGRRAYGRVIPSRIPGHRQIVVREPVGPVAAFTPWNFPVLTPVRKIGGALAAGCACVLKPAEETPGSAIEIMRCLVDAGLPPGVLNIVFGVPADVSAHLIRSPIIRKVSFTGSTAVGRQIAALAALGPKPTSMELGGHAPVLIFGDADVASVAAQSMRKFGNSGQSCISPTRFYVHRSLHTAFISTLAASVERLTLGNGLDTNTGMGPMANPRRVSTMQALIDDAVGHGARLVTGGRRGPSPGFYWQPTILADVPLAARIMNEEPFGPVIIANAFDDPAEAIAEANRLPVGLAAYAFTADNGRAIALGEQLESGMVGINTYNISVEETPFGGVKDSGYGSEGGSESLESYLTTKFVSQM
jgi:succinate-semialdehyde dehydrogenase/glutarate-semialdehyde dehydrogenase